MSDYPEERRRFQRLDLPAPIWGVFDGAAVRIVDVGLVGALIEHEGPLETERTGVLAFTWEDHELTFDCRVVRTGAESGSLYHSGLEIVAARDDSDARLRTLIAASVARIVAAQEANAFGDRQLNWIDSDRTLTAVGSARRASLTGYVTWRLIEGVWKKSAALLPDQPKDGFTVPAWEEDEQVERLRRSYEEADAEGRQFLRMLAELSTSEARGIPPRR
jgi:hypothetical protein